MGAPASREVAIDWLRRVRWAEALAQALAVPHLWTANGAGWMAILVPFVTAASNLAFSRTPPGRATVASGLVLALDTATLTALLASSGGFLNPFTILYLVVVVLSALILDGRAAWGVAALAVAGYASLWLLAPASSLHMSSHEMNRHLAGMWLAFVVAGATTMIVVTSLRRQLERREAELATLQARQRNSARLAALATLASGAAHEIATPLGTIAVVVDELRAELAAAGRLTTTGASDIAVIKAQLVRCRTILDEMGAGVGALPGEAPRRACWRDILRALGERLEPDLEQRLRVSGPGEEASIEVPVAALARALESLIRNGADASAPDQEIEISASVHRGLLRIAIGDRGAGLAEEARTRAGEPFYTTKPNGLGLGLFVTRSLAEALGGAFSLVDRDGGGALAELTLPTRLAGS